MQTMKDSGIEWIGQIPPDWDIVRVKQAFIRKNKKAQQENPVVLALARAGVKIRDVSTNEGQVAESYYNYNPVSVGDLLLNPMDLYSGANCSISEVEGVISPAYINLKNKNGYFSKFYDYYFKAQYWMMVLFAHGKGVSFDNRWTLNQETLMNLPIVAPDYENQIRIANFLDKKCGAIDRYIEKQQQVIEKLKAYKQAVITEAVTKGLNPDAPMKDSGVEWIGEIPEHWEVARIKNIATFQTGSTPSTLKTEYFDGELPWYTPSDFNENYILKDSTRSLSIKAKEYGVATIIPSNVVMVIGIGGTAGKIGYSEKECSCNQQITALIPKDIEPKYLMFWMISNSIYLKDTALYTTLPILNNSTIGNYSVLVPTHEEQLKIVKFLEKKCEDINSNIEKKKLYLEKLIEYKKSLIYEAVTGKIEV